MMFGNSGLAGAWSAHYPDVRRRLRCWTHGRWVPCEPCMIEIVRSTGKLIEGWPMRHGRLRP